MSSKQRFTAEVAVFLNILNIFGDSRYLSGYFGADRSSLQFPRAIL